MNLIGSPYISEVMNEAEKQISLYYNHLEKYNCLCEITSKTTAQDLWDFIYKNGFEGNDTSRTDDIQLLCSSFIRLTGEVYLNMNFKHQCVCHHVHELFEIFLSEDLWTLFIHHLKWSEDQYLVYSFIKAFCYIHAASTTSITFERFQSLFSDIKDNIFAETNINVLNFLSHIVDFKFKFDSDCHSICNNTLPNVVHINTDFFQSINILFSQHWDSFMKQFHEANVPKYDNPTLIEFLILWLKIIQKVNGQDLLRIYLNKDFVIGFLSNAYHMDVISLRMYLDIVLEYFINRKMTSSQENFTWSVEESVVAAVNNNFFGLLPCNMHISGLGVVTKYDRSLPEENKTCDPVIVRKVTVIFLGLINDFKHAEVLFDVLAKVFNFVKHNFGISHEAPVYQWIMDVFIEQDDILFLVLLMLLRIYITLRKDDSMNDFPKCTELKNSLNPHEIFISFLKQIGFDHNELLAFLTSDETCFLFYLVEYLKLILLESDIFIESYFKLMNDETVLECKSCDDKLPNTASDTVLQKLVCYSSSSSEEDLPPAPLTEDQNEASNKQNILPIITFKKLKEAIKKLVSAQEFPYNVQPLISLLQSCENHFLL